MSETPGIILNCFKSNRPWCVRIGLPPSSRRPGYTLTELVVGMTVSSVIMLAITQTLYVASSINEDNDNRFKDVCDGGGGLGQLSRELTTATSVTSYTARSITFTVPDRDSDSNPETISYTWSGTPNDSLIRTENAGSPTTYARNVQDFDMQFATGTTTRTETVTVPGATTNLGIVFSFEGWPTVFPLPVPIGYRPTSTSWACQFFQIPDGVIPSNSEKFQITKVAINASWASATGNVTVSVHRTVGGGNPDPHPNSIGTPAVIAASTLPVLPAWIEFNFSDVALTNPGSNKDFAIVVKGSPGLGSANILYLTSTSAPKDAPIMLWSTNTGGTWDPKKNVQHHNDMLIRVYGNVTSKDSQQTKTITDTHLRRVFVSLRNGAASANRHVCTVRTLNRPVLSSS